MSADHHYFGLLCIDIHVVAFTFLYQIFEKFPDFSCVLASNVVSSAYLKFVICLPQTNKNIDKTNKNENIVNIVRHQYKIVTTR